MFSKKLKNAPSIFDGMCSIAYFTGCAGSFTGSIESNNALRNVNGRCKSSLEARNLEVNGWGMIRGYLDYSLSYNQQWRRAPKQMLHMIQRIISSITGPLAFQFQNCLYTHIQCVAIASGHMLQLPWLYRFQFYIALSLCRGHCSSYNSQKSPHIWPLFYHCNQGAVCTIV